MSNSTTLTKKVVKKALFGATLLAAGPALAKTQAGQGDAVGKAALGVNQLSLDESPGSNATLCLAPEVGKKGGQLTPNEITVAVDPFASSFIELVFTVRETLASDTDYLLFLVTGPQLTPPGSPEIPTPTSKNELRISLAALEILAMYNIPKQKMLAQQETRLGRANPAPRTTVSFSVNLDTGVLPRFMDGSQKAYVQAGLIPARAWENERYDSFIMSELDTINFVKLECPKDQQKLDPEGNPVVNPETNEPEIIDYTSVAMDDGGTMTVADSSGHVGKTVVTASASAEAVAVTK